MAKHYSYEHECSIEVQRGDECEEVELTMHFDVDAPEPDVGLFGFGVSDCEFTLRDGSPLPDDVRAAIEADDKFEDSCCEKAVEDFDPTDYLDD